MIKRKKKVIFFSIIILVLLSGIGLHLYNKIYNPSTTSIFFDKEYGIVKIEVYKTKLFELFQQSVTFVPDNVEVGNAIVMQDRFTVPDIGNDCLSEMKIDLFKNNVFVQTYPVSCITDGYTTGSQVSKDITFTPTSPGVYTAKTFYYHSALACVACDDGGGQMTENSENSLTVTAVQTCDEDWEAWENDHDITGGVVQKRDKVDCEGDVVDTEYRTSCNSGYQIIGTNGDTVDNGQTSCESIDIPEENNTGTECNSDVTNTCWNNSTIIIQSCVNGYLIPQNNTCPTQPVTNTTNTTTNSTNITTTSNCWSIVNSTCVSTVISSSSCTLGTYTTKLICETNIPQEDTTNYDTILYIIIGSLVFILVIVFFIIRFRK
jgi:hypothetical protein